MSLHEVNVQKVLVFGPLFRPQINNAKIVEAFDITKVL